MNSKRFFALASLIALTLVILGLSAALTKAQAVAPATPATIQPTLQLTIPPPQVRTWKEMEAAAALEAAGPPRPAFVKPFRPTADEATYKAHKAQAAQTNALLAPAPAAPLAPLAPLAPTTLTNTISFDGVQAGTNPGQAGNSYPPDTEGVVGPNHFVEITNTHIDIYQKAAPNTRVNGGGNGVTLSAFFNYSTQGLFDPRVNYDPVEQHWIVSADAFRESTSVQYFFFAVSQTADPTGNYYIYRVNVNDATYSGNSFWDFPQLGMDANAVIFTANLFNGNNYVDARMFTVAKSLVYTNNGPNPVTLTPHVFTGLTGTLAPPIVLDTNPNTYLVAAPYTGSSVSSVFLYTLTNSAANPPNLSAAATIPVTAYTWPPNAPQPGQGTTHVIDTSDGRFVNASTQIGNSLFQVHSISRDPLSNTGAMCRFYEFDTVNRQVIQSGDFARSTTSFDFNASIAANKRRGVFVTWSATDPTNDVYAEVRFSGRQRTDPPGVIPSGSTLPGGGSTVALTGNTVQPTDPPTLTQRWGDYSAVSIDPADPSGATAWIVNEKVADPSHWGSRIGRISLPPSGSLVPTLKLLLLDD
jgi:hypothetical protein